MLYDSAGRPVQLGERLGGGGEGEVFRLRDQPQRAAKVFHPSRLTPELARKLAVMRTRRPDDPNWSTRRHRSFAWVEELVFSDTGGRACAGYLMPAVDLDLFRQAHTYYDTADRVRRFGGEFTWRHLLAAAFNLASSMAALHAEGHRIGDLRETNVLVAPNALVTLVDCDSFEVHGAAGEIFPTRVGTAEYLPPELQGADLAQPCDRLDADRFGLAVLIFQLLMLGAHPFQARGRAVEGAPSTDAKIRLGLFAYGGSRRDLQPPEFAPPWQVLPPELRALFRRAFVEGHARPERRPSAADWTTALDAAGARLRTCSANPHHRFAGHLRACPWCARRRGGGDPFPAVPRSGGQRPEAAAGPGPSPAERRAWLRSHAELAVADGELTTGELSFLKTLGSGLGLRSREVSAVLGDARPSRRPPEARDSAAAGPREALRISFWALPAGVVGWFAPLPAIAALVLVVLPLLALGGEALERLAAGDARWRLALEAVPRSAQTVLRSIENQVPALLPAGALLVLGSQARLPPALQRGCGAAAVAALALWTGWSVSTNRDDPFYRGLLRASSALAAFRPGRRPGLTGP